MEAANETDESRRPSPVDRFLDDIQGTAFFQDARTAGSFEWYLAYYRQRAPWRRRLFRLSGLWVIVVAVLLPLIAAFGRMFTDWATAKYGDSLFFHYDLWLGVASASIALAGSLQAFFRWDVVWQGYLDAQRTLERLRDRWQLTTTLARGYSDLQKGLDVARAETAKFVEDTWRAVDDEARGFFSRISFPDPGTSHSLEHVQRGDTGTPGPAEPLPAPSLQRGPGDRPRSRFAGQTDLTADPSQPAMAPKARPARGFE